MGTEGLENKKGVSYAEYDFSKDGGAIGDIELRGAPVPDDAIVTSGVIHVITALAGATATIAVKIQSAADIRAATAVASYSANALLDVIPDGTAGNMIRATANRTITLTVATAALTAGKLVVALEWFRTV